MFDKMKELMELKRKMDDLKSELDKLELESEDNNVSVRINGSQEVRSITIKRPHAALGQAELEASLKDTVNRAIRQSQKSAAEKMASLKGFNIPGLG